MTTPNIRALCAELVDWVERASDLHRYGTQDLITRARAALAEPEPEGEELTDALVDDLFNRFADSCDEYGLWSMGKDGLRAAIAALAEPEPVVYPAPDPFEVGRLATFLAVGSDCGSGATLSSKQCRLILTFLQPKPSPHTPSRAAQTKPEPTGSASGEPCVQPLAPC
jgi:hypothetical protein